MKQTISNHYDHDYFAWQKSIGEFGGWANITKFSSYIGSNDTVLDFGCGGGFLLENLTCKKKLGVELNESAIEMAKQNGIDVYKNCSNIEDASVDVIISNNALEHTFYTPDEK